MVAKAKNKGRKVNRNRKCSQNERYIAEGRHAKSHERRIVKHLKKFPGDAMATTALDRYRNAHAIRRAP